MIKSMTGYGLSKLDNDDYNVAVEIKSLNSKFLDTILKLPKEFGDKEIEIKNLISDQLVRGKVNIVVSFQRKEGLASKMMVNEPLFKEYFNKLRAAANAVGDEGSDIFKLAMQMPEVLVQEELDDNLNQEWNIVSKQIAEAIEGCDNFRVKEGKGLQEKLVNYIEKIKTYLTEIEVQDPKRVEAIRERLTQKIHELSHAEKVDENRFEQELIYYIEKLDINEEKVRLKSHLDYFLEVIELATSQGKKLGFISQEIGREINTIGSKANDANIQRLVVGMKEELEKIKEQLLNIL